MILSNKLKDRRKELGLTMLEVAKKANVSEATVSRWESGDIANMRRDKIVLLAQALQVPPSFIMGCTQTSSTENISDELFPYNPKIHKIPVLGYISAGLPLYAEQHIEDYTYTDRNGGAEYFALKVKGDSMNAAKITDGDILIVRRQDIVENGEIAVVMVDKENATVKRYRREGNIIQLSPQSYNPVHQIQIYDLKKTDVRVIGKVVECKIEF